MDAKQILKLIHFSERLKNELRHSWTSKDRQESVAEHTWRMSLMASLIAPKLNEKVDLTKVLKMIIIHDLSEAFVGDTPAFMLKEKEAKEILEKGAMEKMKLEYNDKVVDEIAELWKEYTDRKTPEAKFATALDKMEVRIQHNESTMDRWNEVEYPRSQFAADKYCNYDKFLKELNELVKEESKNKIIKESKKDFSKVKKEAEDLAK